MADRRRKLKIAMFHFGFFYSGGGEKLVLEELKGLRGLGHEVTCFAPYVDREHCFPDIPEMAEIQTLLPPPPTWLPLRHAIWVLMCCILIPLMAPRFTSFDVLFGANQPAPWFAFVLGTILGKPYIVYLAQPLRLLHPRPIDIENGLKIRDGDQSFVSLLAKLAGGLIDWSDRISLRNADAILANGEYISGRLREAYGIEAQVCSAGCHPLPEDMLSFDSRWSGELSVNGRLIRKPYCLLTNRHSPQKRFEYAIWAIKLLNKKAPNLTLVVTGQETEYTDKLRYLVHGLGLDGKVEFVGLVDEGELSRLYSEAALYVYPSPDEDFGMGIIESMAAGTPVVAWNWGGPTLTVKDGVTGFLATPYEAEEFVARIYDLATNPTLAAVMGKAANKRAREMFSYQRHNSILDEHLAQVTSPGKEPDAVEAHFKVALEELSVAEEPSPLGEVVRVNFPAMLDDSSKH